MRYHEPRLVHRLSAAFLVSAACAAGTGCVSPWWNGFLTPQELGNFRDNQVNEIQRAISFRDKPLGIAGAVDPTPEDLVASVEEYMIGAGDMLSIRLMDFLQLGVETELTPIVDERGYIHVPQLDWMHVEGLTLRQLQEELIRKGKEKGIYAAEAEPTMVVQTLTRQQRLYNISGAIGVPGTFPIIRPDFRLREAINQAGNFDPNIRYVYIFRNEPRPKKYSSTPAKDRPVNGREQTPPAPPVTPTAMSDMSAAGSPPPPAAAGQARPAMRVAAAQNDAERELREALAPGTTPVGTPKAAGPSEPRTTAPAAPPTIIYVNDGFVAGPAPAPGSTASTPPATKPLPGPEQVAPPRASAPAAETVDWESLAAEGQQRVIRVPADRLRSGDANYNVVIHHQDWIELDPGSVGVFYMAGHVNRPGVYSLSGNEITLTQAIASAGGLDQLAWPTRCEIRRRIDGDREETTQWDLSRIVDGQDPDLFIKKDDVINVGTHAIAPLLATIRSAFRFTYGFGFVYDRNFADIDAYAPQVNANDRHRAERAARGLLN